jgi:hypothetical protein
VRGSSWGGSGVGWKRVEEGFRDASRVTTHRTLARKVVGCVTVYSVIARARCRDDG